MMKSFLLVFAPVLLAGLAASWLLARSVRNALLGHEPSAFARMYLQREDVLDHLSECLLAVAPDGKILFTNAQARKLFRWEVLPEDFPLWEEIHAAFDEGVSRADLLTEWAEYTFLAKNRSAESEKRSDYSQGSHGVYPHRPAAHQHQPRDRGTARQHP